MTTQFSDDVTNVVQKYITNPGRQINLASTVISFWYTGAVMLGIFLIAVALGIMVFKESYVSGQVSKRGLIILAWIGFAMILFGIWATINSFYGVVAKINNNIKAKKGCSLFQFENPVNAINIIASEATKDDALGAVVQKEITGASDYGAYSGYADATTNSRIIDKARSPLDLTMQQQTSSGLSGSSGPYGSSSGQSSGQSSSQSSGFSFGRYKPFDSSPSSMRSAAGEAKQMYEDFKSIQERFQNKDISSITENLAKFIDYTLTKLNLKGDVVKGPLVLKDFKEILENTTRTNTYSDAEKEVRKAAIAFLTQS